MTEVTLAPRICEVCGDRTRPDNRIGICTKKPECRRAREARVRRAQGIPARGEDLRPYGRREVMAGDVFGCWVALENYEHHEVIRCRCECDNERLISIRYLLENDDQVCHCRKGAGRMPGRPVGAPVKRIYLAAGAVIGQLTTLEDAGYSTDQVLCRCECGAEARKTAELLKAGRTRSCGCLRVDRRRTHGLTKHPLYRIWYGMVWRCTSPNAHDYPAYGGRGITICDRWLGLPDGLVNFAADMGDRPSPDHSIDRQDVDGGYTPENCRWATSAEQYANRRSIPVLTSERDALLARVAELEAQLAGRPV
jgi:hypothetical protein